MRKRVLAIVIVLAVVACALACATPEGVRKKSEAQQTLYADLDKAYATYVQSTALLLGDRDHIESAVHVAAGNAIPSFADSSENADTKQTLAALRAFGDVIGIARIQYGVVNRFLQIKVFDEADAADLTSKLNGALPPAAQE